MEATVTDSSSSSNNPLNLDSIPAIDLRLLSQSDLISLSSLSPCSNQSINSTTNLHNPDNTQIINPIINRSIFNESAGSRKQTYSRLRLLSSSSSSANPSYHSQKKQSFPVDFDPESKENKKIVSLLHTLFTRNKPRGPVSQKDLNFIVELGNLKEPFDSELKKRTMGLDNEDDLLGFLNGLPGVWGSRRKKKKIVDARDFGDVLPNGWKLLLSVRMKDGKLALCCSRYISPNGLQFKSCKEVSLYLLSLSEPEDVKQPTNVNRSEDIDVEQNSASRIFSQVL